MKWQGLRWIRNWTCKAAVDGLWSQRIWTVRVSCMNRAISFAACENYRATRGSTLRKRTRRPRTKFVSPKTPTRTRRSKRKSSIRSAKVSPSQRIWRLNYPACLTSRQPGCPRLKSTLISRRAAWFTMWKRNCLRVNSKVLEESKSSSRAFMASSLRTRRSSSMLWI